tara:strand:- start:27076 stop:27831 length:756 start_codon:yes stop_codon:yes gene_type:complete
LNPHERNIAIESLIQRKEAAREPYTFAEREFIAQYEGAGGLASKGARGQGLLHEFYTPEWLCKKIWELAIHHGYDGGSILEPSCGTGRFLKDAPKHPDITAFEINPFAARITKVLYPQVKVYDQHFETAFLQGPRYTSVLTRDISWLLDYPFSLVISNPPYGKYSGQYAPFFKKEKFKQFETFFMFKSLQLLKRGGLLVFVTSSNIMRSGVSYQGEKEKISELADLVDAYRLPPVFKHSQVPTDIIILRRK